MDKADVRGAGFGFAGYDWPEDRLGHERLVASLELPTRTGACAACVLGNDTLVGRNGTDSLNGGRGEDRCVGGEDNRNCEA